MGRWVDHAPSRLRTLLTTVSVNRIVVIAACVCWVIIIAKDVREGVPMSTDPTIEPTDGRPLKLHRGKDAIFLLILALGILERLSRLTNLISIERDWLPTMVAAGTTDKQQPSYDLSRLNAAMSRIDLICKLGSPIAISAFISATSSPQLGAVLLIGLNILTWPLEYWTARNVWQGNEQLREAKFIDVSKTKELADGENKKGAGFTLNDLLNALKTMLGWACQYGQNLQQYFATEVWMPSLAMSSLHFSVLTFSSTLIVFLVNSGFSMTLITWAEVLSGAFELCSTFIFPGTVRILSPSRTAYHPLSDVETTSTPTTPLQSTFEVHDDIKANSEGPTNQDQTIGVSRLGLLAIAITLLTLIPSVPIIWRISTTWPTNPPSTLAWQAYTALTLLLILFISFSRLGRFTCTLCAQQLAQSLVPSSSRSTFAGTEASLASTFGLAHYTITVIWNTHSQFRWTALSSVLVVGGGAAMYAFWLLVVARRGRMVGR